MVLLHTLKFFLISIGVLFTALGVHFSLLLISEFLVTHVSLTRNFFLVRFQPHYLFLLLNAIIISIFVSSKFLPSHPLPSNYVAKPCSPSLSLEEEQTWIMCNQRILIQEEPSTLIEESTWITPEIAESTRNPPPLPMEDVWEMIVERHAMAMKESEAFTETREKEDSECGLREEELNRRAEEFIRKFKEELRMQKQESYSDDESVPGDAD